MIVLQRLMEDSRAIGEPLGLLSKLGELLKNVLKDRGKMPQVLNVRRTLRYVELSQY